MLILVSRGKKSVYFSMDSWFHQLDPVDQRLLLLKCIISCYPVRKGKYLSKNKKMKSKANFKTYFFGLLLCSLNCLGVSPTISLNVRVK